MRVVYHPPMLPELCCAALATRVKRLAFHQGVSCFPQSNHDTVHHGTDFSTLQPETAKQKNRKVSVLDPVKICKNDQHIA